MLNFNPSIWCLKMGNTKEIKCGTLNKSSFMFRKRTQNSPHLSKRVLKHLIKCGKSEMNQSFLESSHGCMHDKNSSQISKIVQTPLFHWAPSITIASTWKPAPSISDKHSNMSLCSMSLVTAFLLRKAPRTCKNVYLICYIKQNSQINNYHQFKGGVRKYLNPSSFKRLEHKC